MVAVPLSWGYNARTLTKGVSMPERADSSPLLRFGPYQLDLRACELRKGETILRLAPQPCRVLALLVSHPRRVFTRQEIYREIWGDETFVDFDQGLNAAIRQIRSALCDDAEMPRYIETLPRRGYRFIAQVEGPPGGEASTPLPMGTEPAVALRPSSSRRPLVMVATGALLAAGVVVGWRIQHHRSVEAAARGTIRSIAVLPLANLSQDPEQEYFVDGMTDELITNLAKSSPLRVISRTSVMRYRNVQKPVGEIGKELGADALIEGSVVRSGNSVRITVQLIQAATDRHLWAEEYQGDLQNVLDLQAQVARAITKEVQVKLTPQQEMQLAKTRQVDPEAHDAYLRGLYLLTRNDSESKNKAIGYFQAAIARSPNDPLAYAAISDAYYSLWTERAPMEIRPEAEKAAGKAVELDPTLADAHVALGEVKLAFNWDWPGAEREFKAALELNPNLSKARVRYASYLSTLGRTEETVAEVERAHQLDPVSPHFNVDIARSLTLSRHYNEAIDLCRRTIELEPNALGAYGWITVAQTLLGHSAESVRAADRAIEVARLNGARIPYEAVYAYAMAGQKGQARKLVTALVNRSGHPYICGYNMGIIFLALGEKNEALKWLDKAFRDHST